MDLRPALKTGGALAFGIIALDTVASGLNLTMTPGRGDPSGDWAPMPDPADGGVPSPPFPVNLTAEERANLATFDALDFEVFSKSGLGTGSAKAMPGTSGCISPTAPHRRYRPAHRRHGGLVRLGPGPSG